MKKALALVLGIMMLLSMASASVAEAADPYYTALTYEDNLREGVEWVDTTAFKKDGPYTFGFSNIEVTNSWRVQCQHEVEAACERNGIELILTDANGDISKQISDIQDLMANGVDALIIDTSSPTATASVTRQAIDMGIPVIAFHNELSIPESYIAFVGTDQYAYGRVIAEWLVEQLGGEGKIINVRGIAGTDIDYQRNQALLDVINETKANITILAEYYTDWDYAQGKQATEQALAAFPEIDGFYSTGGAASQGIIEAIAAANREMVPVTGEINNGFLKTWKLYADKGLTSIAPGDPSIMGAQAVYTAMKVLAGERVPKSYIIPTANYTVTQDTLDTYLREDLSDNYWAMNYLSEADLEKWYK